MNNLRLDFISLDQAEGRSPSMEADDRKQHMQSLSKAMQSFVEGSLFQSALDENLANRGINGSEAKNFLANRRVHVTVTDKHIDVEIVSPASKAHTNAIQILSLNRNEGKKRAGDLCSLAENLSGQKGAVEAYFSQSPTEIDHSETSADGPETEDSDSFGVESLDEADDFVELTSEDISSMDKADDFVELTSEDISSIDERDFLIQQMKPRMGKKAKEANPFSGAMSFATKMYRSASTKGTLFAKDKIFMAMDARGLREWEKPELYASLRSINEKTYLSPGAIDAWSQKLMERNPRLLIEKGSTHERQTLQIPDLKEDIELYGIPVVIKGKMVDHVVTFVYHKPSHTLVFYDSKGHSLYDYREANLAKANEKTSFFNAYAKIMTKYKNPQGTYPHVWMSDAKHQEDTFNCGVYIMKWTEGMSEALISSDTPEMVSEKLDNLKQSAPSFDEATGSARREIMLEILPDLKEA